MGYSARYHAASLAAVFFALAIGILIGSQIGGDILDNTRKDLESSLTEDLDASRAQVNDLEEQLNRADEFGNSVYPPLTESQLAGDRIGLVGFGSLPGSVTESVDRAIQASGAELVAVGVIRQPPTPDAIAESLSGTKLGTLDGNEDLLKAYGRIAGRQLVVGGRVLALSQSELMSQSSGQFGDLDGLIVFHADLDDAEPEQVELAEALDQALLLGAKSTQAQVVGVEQTDTEPSSVGYFAGNNVTSVDNIDQPAGKVSLVYALAGAEGSFGVKEDSDRLLPELLRPLKPKQGNRQAQNGKQG